MIKSDTNTHIKTAKNMRSIDVGRGPYFLTKKVLNVLKIADKKQGGRKSKLN